MVASGSQIDSTPGFLATGNLTMRTSFLTFATVALAALSVPANANIVFSDNFDGENGGLSALNYTGFTNFATTGNVDLVKTPDYGITCAGGGGSCVDLDGTPGPGEIETFSSFAFNAGDKVSFLFDLSGSQRGTSEDFRFGFRSQGGAIAYNNAAVSSDFLGGSSFGNFFQNDLGLTGFNIASSTPFGNATFSFTAGNAGLFKVFLRSNSSDTLGILIDNVSIDISAAVPEPASWAMMIAGFGLVGGAMRRTKLRFADA
jgi:PEP-CTERM motif